MSGVGRSHQTPSDRSPALLPPTQPNPNPTTITEIPHLFKRLLQLLGKSTAALDAALALAAAFCGDLAVLVALHAAEQPLLPGADVLPNPRLVALLSHQVMPVLDGFPPAPSSAAAAAASAAAAAAALPPTTADEDGECGGGKCGGDGGAYAGNDGGIRRSSRKRLPKLREPAPPRPTLGGGGSGGGGAQAFEDPKPPPFDDILPAPGPGAPRTQCYYCNHELKSQKAACLRASPTTRCQR